MKALEENGLLEDMFIILTSDHGESLGEHGIYFDHHGLYDNVIHVPLILKYKKLPKKRIKSFVQHIDLMPTILDVLDFKVKTKIDGESMVPLIFGKKNQLHEAIYVEEENTQRKRAIRTFEYKYIQSLSKKEAVCRYCGVVHGGFEELYDLKNDPEEKKNIINEKPEIASELKKKLNNFVNKKHF